MLCVTVGAEPFSFVDVTHDRGIDFVQTNGASGKKYSIETMGGGVGLLDFDNDGDLDAYLVDGSALPGSTFQGRAMNRLFRNEGEEGAWSFVDVTDQAGVGDPGYGMGCAVGDYDNDGDIDLYVTNFGANVLYRNNGDGTFADVTKMAGVGDTQWSSSAAFLDYDADGDLDLFSLSYVQFTLETNKLCPGPDGKPGYCSPDVYEGAYDVLYRNNGDGSFTDVSKASGVHREGRGMGLVASDFDRDGDLDIYVANDEMENFLYDNLGDGTFDEIGLMSGAAYNEGGEAEAGMGVDFADVDGDGLYDLLIGHYDDETSTLYRNLGQSMFSDETTTSGIGPPSRLRVTFGLVFADLDNDTDSDVFVVNGHVLDNVELKSDVATYKQPNQVMENRSGRFTDVSRGAGSGMAIVKASRGLAAGDIDNDGDIDLLVGNVMDAADLLVNEVENGNWLSVDLSGGAGRVSEGRWSNRDGIGARVICTAGERRQVKDLHSAASYQSANDLRVHFGLGAAETCDVEVVWPSGRGSRASGVRVNQQIVIDETVVDPPFRTR
jgi:enediyne biosynthesis protein E4